MWPYVEGSRPLGGFEMFRVALYEVHTVSNFGSPPLYLDMRQHREALLGDVAATTLEPLCGLLYVKSLFEIVQPNMFC